MPAPTPVFDTNFELLDPVTGRPSIDTSLGTGFNLNSNGSIFPNITTIEQQALENLKHLLLTIKGEIQEKPNFGSDLFEILFEVDHLGNIELLVDEAIRSAVAEYLSYIQITEIQTTVNNNTVNVVISFSVNDIPSPVDIGISVNETSGITVETGNLTNFEGTGIS